MMLNLFRLFFLCLALSCAKPSTALIAASVPDETLSLFPEQTALWNQSPILIKCINDKTPSWRKINRVLSYWAGLGFFTSEQIEVICAIRS